jgi:cell wall-associated NlpC family hydrolase
MPTTIPLLMVLGGGVLIRQALVGRADDLITDTKDLTAAVLTGKWATVSEVAARRGETVDGIASTPVASESGTDATGVTTTDNATNSGAGIPVLTAARLLATKANNRYVYGATGPTAYDCSGLVWQAMRYTGIYTGGRFTTQTFAKSLGSKVRKVTKPQAGDIVVYTGAGREHMGIYLKDGKMFAARSTASGIGEQAVTGTPTYYRLG